MSKNFLALLVGLLIVSSVIPAYALDYPPSYYSDGEIFDTGSGSCTQVTSCTGTSPGFTLSSYPTSCNEQWLSEPTSWLVRRGDTTNDICWEQTCTVSTVECPPAEPATCQNGFLDGDETYADCGGSCVASCVESCPGGYQYLEELGACADDSRFTIVPDGYDCPPSYGFDPDGNGTTQCIHLIPVQYAPESAPAPDDPGFIPAYNSSTLTSSTDITSSVVDNGDGTSTETSVSQTSNQTSTGTIIKETTTTTTIYNTATGQILSANITSEESNSDNSAPGSVGLPVVPDSLQGVTRGDASNISFQPIADASADLMTRFPFSVVTHFENFLDTWVVEPVAPSFDIPMEMIRPEPYQMSLSALDPLAVWFRNLLGFLSYISGGWMIIRTWRG